MHLLKKTTDRAQQTLPTFKSDTAQYKDMIKPTRIRVKLKNLKLVKLVTFIVEMTKHYPPTEPLMSGIIQSQYMEKRIIN